MLRAFCCGFLLFLPIGWLLAQGPPPALPTGAGFWQEQLRYPRVRAARAAQGAVVAAHLQRHRLDPQQLEIFLRLIKTRRELEVWGRPGQGSFVRLTSFPLAATSGTLGPKRRAGDGQMPEGCYKIDRFNPNSNYYLSLGLNYPNAADRALGLPDPGGDIFIHGSDVTIGCLPITDKGISELYVLAVAARAAGQQAIPVHIFPFPLTPEELAKHRSSPHYAFWQSLAPAYTYFEANRKLAAE